MSAIAVEMVCDHAFLDRRERAAIEVAEAEAAEALKALRAADRAESHVRVWREMADALHGWRRCELKSCRRSRRCQTAGGQCVGVRHNAWPLADERAAVDDYYAALQEARLEQAGQ